MIFDDDATTETYIQLLEDLVADYDAIGWENVCHCGDGYKTGDSRCCWVRRTWEKVCDFREEHMGNRWGRLTPETEGR